MLVDADVGAAEAVDGLFGVADDEEFAGGGACGAPVVGIFGGGEQQDEFGLERVGVLEFVDQQGFEAPAEVLAGAGMVANQVAGVEQEVVEGEFAGGAAAVGVPGDEVVEGEEQAVERGAAHGVGELLTVLGRVVPEFAGFCVALVFAGRPDRWIDGEQGHAAGEGVFVISLAAVQVVESLQQRGNSVSRFLAVLDPQIGVGGPPRVGNPLVQRRSRVGDFRAEAGGVEVAVAADELGGLLDVRNRQPVAQHLFQRMGVVQVVLGPDPFVPCVIEIERLAELIEHAEVGVELGLKGAFAEQAGGEGVDGADLGYVHLFLGCAQALLFFRIGGVGQRVDQSTANSGAEFAGGFFGEGDGNDFAQFGLALADGFDHALDHHAGFARARAGFEEEGCVELVYDALAGLLVFVDDLAAGTLAFCGGFSFATSSSGSDFGFATHTLAFCYGFGFAALLRFTESVFSSKIEWTGSEIVLVVHQRMRFATRCSKSAVRDWLRRCLVM